MPQEQLPKSFQPEDATGDKMPGSFQAEQPQMNFAVVNKEYVKPDENTLSKKIGATWDAANKPLINVTPEMKTAMDAFSVDHPVAGKIGEGLTNLLTSISSPLSVGLAALTGGSSLAEKLGLEGLATALHLPGKAAAAGMTGHGLYNIGKEDTIGGKIGGGVEAGLGILGLRGGAKPSLNEAVPELAPHELPNVDMGPDFAPTDTPVAEGGISRGKPIEQLQFELAQKKFGMAKPLVNGETASIPSMVNKEQPMLVNGKPNMANFSGERAQGNFNEGSGGLTDIAAGKFTRHAMPNTAQTAVFQGWQPGIDEIPPQPLYNIKGAHPNGLDGSTVGPQTLKNEGIPIPETPPYKGEHQSVGGMPESFAKHVEPRAKDKLIAALENSKEATKEQGSLNSAERSRRIAQFSGHNISDEASFNQALGELGGKYPKAKFEPIKLDQNDVDSLFKEMSGRLTGYEMPRGGLALQKLFAGEALQPNEQVLLRRAFGEQFADAMRTARPLKNQHILIQAANIPKSMMTFLHFTAPFKQAIGLVHRPEFWGAIDDMFRSFGSEKFAQGIKEAIQADKHFPLLDEVGLSLTHMNEGLAGREEAFMAPILDKLPGMKASARGYTSFLNKVRMDTASSLIDSAISEGLDPYHDLTLAREIAQYVNNATGRGSLGALEKNAVILNTALFSPRLISSRIAMLNPATYIKANPFVRKQYIKSVLGIASAGALVGGLAKAGGGTVSSDRNSSDFGKAKIGDVTLDPYGGFQQYIVAANQFQSGEKDTSTGHHEVFGKFGMPTRASNLIDFGANKLAPVPKLAWDWANASKGRPFNAPVEVTNLFIPMVANDIYELIKEDPSLAPFAIPDALGIKASVPFKKDRSNILTDFADQVINR